MFKSDSNGATPSNTSNFLKICKETKTVLLDSRITSSLILHIAVVSFDL